MSKRYSDSAQHEQEILQTLGGIHHSLKRCSTALRHPVQLAVNSKMMEENVPLSEKIEQRNERNFHYGRIRLKFHCQLQSH